MREPALQSRWISTSQFAKRHGYPVKSVREWVKKGYLLAYVEQPSGYFKIHINSLISCPPKERTTKMIHEIYL